jgi:hypothetical protein
MTLITTHKLGDKAESIFKKHGLSLQYRLSAEGTASSDMMDVLGLGSVDKCVLLSVLPHAAAQDILGKLKRELRMHAVNGGIAFTVPLSGGSGLLLHLAKGIVSSKLDHKLVDTAKLAEFTYEGVPEEVKSGVKSFLDEMRKNLSESGGVTDLPAGQNGECVAVEKNGSGDAVVEAQCNGVIQKGITIFEQFLTLEELKEQERIEKNFYEQEVERAKVDFQAVMSELNAESDALVEIMKGVRTAKSKEQVKRSLLLLCDSDKNISESEWNDILNGDKKLEI